MKYAWIDPIDTVRDVCPGSPAELYHPDVASHYTTLVPEDIVNGAKKVNGVWTNPVSPEPPAPVETWPTFTPVEFKMLFTSQERIAGKILAKTDAVMEDAYEILEDPRLQTVDLNLKSNRDLLLYMQSKGIITDVRRLQILAGEHP